MISIDGDSNAIVSTNVVEIDTQGFEDIEIRNIYIPQWYDSAPQWVKDLVNLVVDVSINTNNMTLINDMNKMLQEFAVSYVPLNQYTQSILDLGNEDMRLNALLETLNSNFNNYAGPWDIQRAVLPQVILGNTPSVIYYCNNPLILNSEANTKEANDISFQFLEDLLDRDSDSYRNNQ